MSLFFPFFVLLPILLFIIIYGRLCISVCNIQNINKSSLIFIYPVIGLAFLIVFVSFYFLFFNKLSSFQSFSYFFISILFGLYFEKNKKELLEDYIKIIIFSCLCTSVIIGPVILFDGFNPFNDTYTYLVHSQWLQQNSFKTEIVSSGFYPAESQVKLYQTAGTRMGASNLLAFIQSAFKFDWSYYVYLPIISLPITIASLTIGGIISQIYNLSQRFYFIISLLPLCLTNGFVFGAQYGFFPQTFGLCFCAGIILLFPIVLNNFFHDKNTIKKIITCSPLCLLISGFLYSYNDIALLFFTPLFIFFCVYIFINNLKLKESLYFIFICVCFISIFLNFELLRILKNLYGVINVASGNVQIGWHVNWNFWEFLTYSFGMRSLLDKFSLLNNILRYILFPIILIILIYVVISNKNLIKDINPSNLNLYLILLFLVNLVYWLIFIKFRYFSTGFVTDEIGNTFVQFKIVKFLAIQNLSLIGIACTFVYVKFIKKRFIFLILLLTFFNINLFQQIYTNSINHTSHFISETGRNKSPFDLFKDLRIITANIPRDESIFIAIPEDSHKITQMITYFLHDRYLASEYKDGYIRGSLPENQRDMNINDSKWLIQLDRFNDVPNNIFQKLYPFSIHQAPFNFFTRIGIKGAYGNEFDKTSNWNWVENNVTYIYSSSNSIENFKITFNLCKAGINNNIFNLVIMDRHKKIIFEDKIDMIDKEGWILYTSKLIKDKTDYLEINISSNGKPSELSKNDRRTASFAIRDLKINYNK